MCGRIVQYRSPQDYAALLDIRHRETSLPVVQPNFNGSPGQDFLLIRQTEAKQPILSPAQWGLIPSGADDPKIAWKLVNARAETVVTTDAFCAAYRYRRCLVPVDGFYEWKKLGPLGKQPHAVSMADGRPFTLAGLW
jgi:putative SOS response-associated peptidase YedK